MIKFAKLAGIVILAFIVSACSAPGQKFTGLEAPANDKGDIYLYRTSAFFASGQAFNVYLDGKEVGKIYNASYLHLRIPEGNYVLKVWPGFMAKSSEIQIHANAGKQVFFQYDFVTGILANVFFLGSSIQPRDQGTALQDLKELKSST